MGPHHWNRAPDYRSAVPARPVGCRCLATEPQFKRYEATFDGPAFGQRRQNRAYPLSLLRGALAVLLVLVFLVSGLSSTPPAAPTTGHSHFTTFAAPAISTSSQGTCTSKATFTSASLGTVAAASSVFIFVSIAQPSAVTVTSVGSTVGGTFTADSSFFTKAGAVTNAGNVREEVWYRSDVAGGATYRVVVNTSATTNFCVVAFILTGANLATAVDVVGSGTTGNNATAGDQQTTLKANDLVFGGIGIKTTATTQTLTAIGSWAIADSNMATSGLGTGTVDQSFAAAQKVNPSVTISTTLQWAALSVSVQVTGPPQTAPTSLAANPDLFNTEHTSWTKPANQPLATVSNYTVFTGAAGGACGNSAWSSWSIFTSVGGSTTLANPTGLSGGTDYCYAVAEWNASGIGPMSSTVTAYTVPQAPTGYACGSPTVTTIACTWTNPTVGAGGLVNDSLYYWAGASCSGTQLGATPSLGVVTLHTVTGLTSATQYSFAVAAWSPGGTSLISTCRTVTTLAGLPTGLSISSTATTSLGLSWTNAAGTLSNITGYSSTTACTGSWTSTSLGTSATSNTFSGLTSATTYCLGVQDWSSAGTGGTAFLNGTTLPTVPTGLTVTGQTSTTISVGWSNPSGTLVNDSVEWTTTACTGSWTYHSLAGTGTSYTVTTLSSATKYCIAVQAYSSGGASAPVFTNGTTIPAAPTSLAVSTETTTSITLTWSNPSGSGLSNISMYRWTGAACSGSATGSSLGVVTTATQSGLSGATKYSFEVAGWSAGGTSAVSSCVQGTTFPTSITGLTFVKATTTSLQFSWTNPAGTLSNDSIAWTTTACTGSWSFGSLGVTTGTTLGGLASATKYCVAIQAYSSSGASAPVFTNDTTLPTVVTGLSISLVTATGFTASWSNPSGTLTNDSVAVTTTACTGTWTYVSTAGAGTSKAITGLSSATKYCVAVQAYSAGGASAPTFTNATTLPGATTGLSVTAIRVIAATASWSAPSGAIANVTLWQWTASSCTGTSTANSLGVVTTTTLTTTSATTFSVQVASWSAGGMGALSSCATFTTFPASVTGLSLSVITTTTITAIWTNPAGTLTNNSLAFTTTGCTGSWTFLSGSGAVTTLQATGLTSSTNYCIAVQAYSSEGASAPTFINGTTASSGPGMVLAPYNLVVTSITQTTITLVWQNPSSVASIQVLYGFQCMTPSNNITLSNAPTTFTVVGLAPLTQYCFNVQGRNTTVYSQLSNSAVAKTVTPGGQSGGGTGQSTPQIGPIPPLPIPPHPTITGQTPFQIVVEVIGALFLLAGIVVTFRSSPWGLLVLVFGIGLMVGSWLYLGGIPLT